MQRLLDAIAISVVYVLVVDWRAEGWVDRNTISILLMCGVFFVSASSNQLYHSWRIDSIAKELLNTFVAWAVTVVAVAAFAVSIGVLHRYWKPGTVGWLVLSPLAISAWRITFRIVAREARRRGHNSRIAVIAGVSTIGKELATYVENAAWTGLRIGGFYEDRDPDGDRIDTLARHKSSGNFDDLVAACVAGTVDVVFITLPFRAELRIRELVSKLANTTASVYLVEDFSTFDLLHGRTLQLGHIPMVSLHETPFYGVDGGVKRLEDIVLGLIIAVVIAVPCLLIALAIKLSSAGPVIYKQPRYGLSGKEILIWKFRTMRPGSDAGDVPQASRDDPRVTPLGRFLRRTSLDELPQFLNVLTGKMSIVGPRPHAVAHNENYRQLLDSYMLRHMVKPGITGWAQINGWRGEIEELSDMKARIEFDLEYIRNWSLLFDLKIIVLTIFKGFSGRKAY